MLHRLIEGYDEFLRIASALLAIASVYWSFRPIRDVPRIQYISALLGSLLWVVVASLAVWRI